MPKPRPPANPLLPATDLLTAPRSALAGRPEAAPVRLCFAAAHVALAGSYAQTGHTLQQPGKGHEIAAHVDWPATLSVRRFLDQHGFGIAEAMDTAQRFQLGWDTAGELIRRCGALELRNGFCAGASTDHLPAVQQRSDLVDGVAWQCRFISQHGGIPVILPMPFLCQQQCGEDDYVEVYGAILRQVEGPVFLHWLGPMFLPALAGYFPGNSLSRVLALDPKKVRGVKLSLLDAALELRVRREILPRDQVVLTGDDFHFGRLILGGDADGALPSQPPAVLRHTTIGHHRVALGDFSHALLGVFDGIAVPAGLALRCLAAGDAAAFWALMAPCEELGRHVFAAPTQHYKAGLAFLAWLNGLQPNPMLVNREDLARDAAHYRRCAELAAACGALVDLPLAEQRLQAWLADRS